MASKYWIKLWHDILDDPKMGGMEDRLWRRTIEMFLLAGEHQTGGILPPVSEMAWRLHLSPTALSNDMDKLIELGIITDAGEGMYIITNFTERQKPIDKKIYNRLRRAQEDQSPEAFRKSWLKEEE